MKTYTVFEFKDGERHGEARNLKLPEAFARMMALAGTEYAFHRYGETMRLNLVRKGPIADLPFLYRDLELCRTMFPLFESWLPDDERARADLMEQALLHGRDSVCAEAERELSAVA